MAAELTNPSALEQRSLGKQVGLSIVTLGLYPFYWMYSTADQLNQATDEDVSPILTVIPLVNLLGIWQLSNASEAVTDQSAVVLFVVFLFLGPLAWFWVQSGINDAASN